MIRFLYKNMSIHRLLILGCVALVFPEITFATETPDVLKSMASVLAILIHVLTFFVILILSWGADLLGTEFITGEKAMEGIRPMWMFIRNIVNIGFVLIFLFLAFANMFQFGGQSNWSIKEKLPKAILALIAINFSLLGFKVAIDAVNVGTVTILSIADTTISEKGGVDMEGLFSSKVCGVDNKPDCIGGLEEGTTFRKAINDAFCKGGEHSSSCLFKIKNEIKADDANKSNLFMAFGVYLQDLEQLPLLAADIDSFFGVLDSILFSAILAAAYAIALIAIFIALLLRMLMLWFFMIFSPGLVAASIMGFGGGGGDIGKKVVTYLIMPLKIAAAFALSFVMISVMIDFAPTGTAEILIPGKALNQFWGQNGFGLLWKILTVIVFWKTAFWALKDTDAEAIINKVQSAGEASGSFLARAAVLDRQILPFPTADGGKTSISALTKAPGQFKRFHDNQAQQERNQDYVQMGIMNGGDAKFDDAIESYISNNKNQDHQADKLGGKISELITALGGHNAINTDEKVAAFQKALEASTTVDLTKLFEGVKGGNFKNQFERNLTKSDYTSIKAGYKPDNSTTPTNAEKNITLGDSNITINVENFDTEKFNNNDIDQSLIDMGFTKDKLITANMNNDQYIDVANQIASALGNHDLADTIKNSLVKIEGKQESDQ